MFVNPDAQRLREWLEATRTIAVVGLSPKPDRPSHSVARAMQGFGYRIVPVNPGQATLLGEPCWPTLSDIPPDVRAGIDLVDVFRQSDAVPGIVDECIALGLRRLWLQDGVVDEASALRAQAAGIEVVMDRCVYRDYVHLVR
ncbi:MAG: CoA-binding protein [Pseudomonadota bacterium]|jgi:predicted CoA-binding protein